MKSEAGGTGDGDRRCPAANPGGVDQRAHLPVCGNYAMNSNDRPIQTWRKSMKNRMTRIAAWMIACMGTLFLGSILQSAAAQDAASFPYMNPKLDRKSVV